ncbi:pyridoxal phosphate-dependent transferase [Mycena amicta]|nr:pyridoxal phosphate-dependent transferase [Mycena amicta]
MPPLSLASFATSVESLLLADDQHALPPLASIQRAEASLCRSIPETGIGFDDMKRHLKQEIIPALNGSALSSNYFGFVTGGATRASLFADWLASGMDQNAQVHSPAETVAGDVEDAALRLLQQLLGLDENEFTGRVFTTGATGSNIIGLALGREYAVAAAGRRRSPPTSPSVAQLGLLKACKQAGVAKIQVFSAMPHSSLYKAASVVGLGHAAITALPLSAEEPWRLDLAALERHIAVPGVASIISISAGEVNTGRFSTSGEEMVKLRALADTYGAWIHVDAAFGLPVMLLPQRAEYDGLIKGVESIELADSITGDAHKNTVQVPYDCGVFFTRHLKLQQTVFQNAPFPIPDTAEIPSAHNLGVENSRRLRGLPVYASLLAYGRTWHQELIEQQIALARTIARYILQSAEYELLPSPEISKVYMIVLFRARNEALNVDLVQRLNDSKIIYVSGTQWDGAPATRIAVSNWRVDVERDSGRVIRELERVGSMVDYN